MDGKVIVDEILEFLANKPKDMFCLGKFSCSNSLFSSAHSRPVLIKLSTAWDHKLILLCKSKLHDLHISRLFLRGDDCPDHRLHQKKSKSTGMDHSDMKWSHLMHTDIIIPKQLYMSLFY